MSGSRLCRVADVAIRTGREIETGSTEWQRTDAACAYVSAVLRARFPLIPDPAPSVVSVVATEVAVRYMGADPASGGVVSEQLGGYHYRRSESMGRMALLDDEWLVLAPYAVAGASRLGVLQLSNSAAGDCRCGLGRDEECFAVGHAPQAPLSGRVPMP